MQSKSQAQPNVPSECSELFISELYFDKDSISPSQIEINYAVEIFNPTGNAINLSNYSLNLTNSSNQTVNIPLSGTIAAKDVYLVCNANGDLPLTQLADALTPLLDFENNLVLELSNNAVVIDKIGEGVSGVNLPFDILAFIADPAGYLASFHLDLNDYRSIDVRRGLFVTKGEPNFTTLGNAGNWYYRLNTDRSNLGTHLSNCNIAAGTIHGGFLVVLSDLVSTITPDPLLMSFNGPSLPSFFSCDYDFLPAPSSTPIFNLSNLNNNAYFGRNTTSNSSSCSSTNLGNCETINLSNCNFAEPTRNVKIQFSTTDTNIIVDAAREFKNITLHRCPTNVNEIELIKKFKFHYNSNSIFVDYSEDINYSIIDPLGKIIINNTLEKNFKQIDISNLSNGMYFLKLIDKNQTYTFKIIKN